MMMLFSDCIIIKDGKAAINLDECIFCGECEAACKRANRGGTAVRMTQELEYAACDRNALRAEPVIVSEEELRKDLMIMKQNNISLFQRK